MRRRPQRHPVIETAVFAAALLLSAFIARELWRRRGAAATATMRPIALNSPRSALSPEAAAHRAERAVTSVAPLKLTRVRRRTPEPIAVPAPR